MYNSELGVIIEECVTSSMTQGSMSNRPRPAAQMSYTRSELLGRAFLTSHLPHALPSLQPPALTFTDR